MTEALIACAFSSLMALSATAGENLGFDPVKDPQAAAAAYIAPENAVLYRMRHPNGTYREFEHDFAHPDVLRGANGWRGRVRGETIVIRSGKDVEGGPATFTFLRGRLVEFRQGEMRLPFAYDAPRAPAGSIAPYWVDEEGAVLARHDKRKAKVQKQLERRVEKVVMGKWKKSGRLQWPFVNPNENGFFYGSLALLALFLFFVPRRPLRILGGVLFLAGIGAMVASASRGAFLGFAVGLVPIVGLRFRSVVRSKSVWILCALVLTASAAWFLTHDAKLLTRGFTSSSAWSNESRLEMWRAAPAMLVEAPGGWDIVRAGGSYMDWYQPLDVVVMPGSMVNDHLTILVGLGWCGRFAYLFGWLFALGALAVLAWRSRNGVALGVWMMLALDTWFNPLLFQVQLWTAPLLALALAIGLRSWRLLRPRALLAVAGGAALIAAAVLAAVYVVGEQRATERGYSVRKDGERLLVKASNPRTWVVDDYQTLGGALSCKEIRTHYALHPHAAPIGFVRDVKNLPPKVDRLVLAGRTGDDWMRMMSEGGAEAQRNLPREVVFVSPPFPPSALPEGFLKACKVRMLVGEFVARYNAEYASPPDWVEIVPALELYFPDWMSRTVGN